MLKEFKAFALRGNVLDLAVGVVLGVAFGAVVNSVVGDLIMPLIAALVGQPDFNGLVWTIRETPVRYGAFLTALVNFVLVAFAVFLLIKAINRLQGVRPEESKNRECPHCLSSIPKSASRCSACTSEVTPEAA